MLTLPFLVQLFSGVLFRARSQIDASILETPWRDEAWRLAITLARAWLCHLPRLPARLLLGPMLVGAAVHIRGWIRFVPAVEIVNFAQLVLGTTTGCRLPGTSPWEMTHILVLSLGATAILLALTPGFAAGMSQVSSYGEIPLLLAYSPCGLAEMSLVAVSIDSEVAFVAAHHSIRVFIVMLGAAPSSAILKRWM